MLCPRLIGRALLSFAVAAVALVLAIKVTHSQTGAEPRTVHNACAGNCVADVIFLHSGMGDRMAENAFHAWYDSYYELAGCGDSAWRTDFEFLLDLVAEFVGAPGGTTMQCWQGLLGQAKVCGGTCSDYFIKDSRYGPNVRVVLNEGSPGYLDVTLDNVSNLNNLPEYQPNAYSRRFRLLTSLKYGDGEPLVVNAQDMPSLSFPNWITNGGLDSCITQYGADHSRCKILAYFALPSEVTTPVEFMDGVLYDLSGVISKQNGVNGSFAEDGYIRLLSDGDNITFNQGPYAGLVVVKKHDKENDLHTLSVTPWDATAGAVKITNHECNCFFCLCNVTGTRTDSDTYVFALRGPGELRLPGTYTVEVVAEISHERDFSDNRMSYTYEAGAAGDQTGGDSQAGQEQQTVADLVPVEIIPGVYPGSPAAGVIGDLYRLPVPEGVHSVYIRNSGVNGARFSLFVRRGERPIPYFPQINDDYDCWDANDAETEARCFFLNPAPGDVYILVNPLQEGGSYQLTVEWTLESELPGQDEGQQDGQAGSGEGQDSGTQEENTALSESEPNNKVAEANLWGMDGTFTGQLSKAGDRDTLRIPIRASGIYTVALGGVPAQLRARLELLSENGVVLLEELAAGRGQPVNLTFDGSQGEIFFLSVLGSAMGTLENQSYRLELIGMVPDPMEPNDILKDAAAWTDFTQPLQGYFWDRVRGRVDDYSFQAPDLPGSSLLIVHLENVAPNIRPRVHLYNESRVVLKIETSPEPGQGVVVTADANPGELFYLQVEAVGSERTSSQPYLLRAELVPDPLEPNDTQKTAAVWDLTSGALQGFFWEKASGRADFYHFIAPQTRDGAPVSFELHDVPDGIRPKLRLYSDRQILLIESGWGTAGQPLSISQALEAGREYTLMVLSYNNESSSEPYTLSAVYTSPPGSDTGEQSADTRAATIWGIVYRPSGLLIEPLPGVEIFAHLPGQPPEVLATSSSMGLFMASIDVPEGQQVEIWADREGLNFEPETVNWLPQGILRSHRVTFMSSGPEITLEQTTPMPPVVSATPRLSGTPRPKTATPFKPTGTSATALETTTLPGEQVTVKGHVYRLWPGSDPVGLAAVEVKLDVNGVPAGEVQTRIDGGYLFSLSAVNAEDLLRLYVTVPGTSVEPVQYTWKSETDIGEWSYDFYTYAGTITPPAGDGGHRIFGRVTDGQGRGVPGVVLLLQMGTSDGLQLLGPTDADGYYDTTVRLPDRIMVSVWVKDGGFIPVRRQFFHAFGLENRELDFRRLEATPLHPD